MTDDPTVTTPGVTTTRPGVARVWWPSSLVSAGFAEAVGVVSALVAEALTTHGRVEAWVDPDDTASQRIATWSGLHREGVMRGGHVDSGTHHDRVVYARVASDPPVGHPEGFRALLNSFLPRKRAISQLLVRDDAERVLLCQLTYKRDWDLPGGVVEVGESPQLAAAREVQEELGLALEAGPLLLTDWLPSWGGWDDALCLVFDGGVQAADVLGSVVMEEREIASVQFCTLDEVQDRCADFTARRVSAALANLREGPSYTESGR